MAGEDTSVIEFEVSGNNSVHAFIGKNGPQFYYTTTDGVSHKVGYSYGNIKGGNKNSINNLYMPEISASSAYG